MCFSGSKNPALGIVLAEESTGLGVDLAISSLPSGLLERII